MVREWGDWVLHADGAQIADILGFYKAADMDREDREQRDEERKQDQIFDALAREARAKARREARA